MSSESTGERDADPGVSALAKLDFVGPPLNRAQLDDRVSAIAGALDVPVDRARVLVGSLVAAQMLPFGTVVKGGIGVKLRLGETGTRATRDVDVVTRDREQFLADLNQRLTAGWGTVPPSKGQLKKNADAPPRVAFSGTARPGKQARPEGVVPEYLMEPYFITLEFMGTGWAKVFVEVAQDEIGGLEYADLEPEVAGQVAAVGAVLGFGVFTAVPLISLEQQLAQKIHAATQPESDRAHDLVDIQLLWRAGTDGGQGLDVPLLGELCRRTFAYRHAHNWPPVVWMPDILDPAYQSARDEAGPRVVVATLAEANEWLRQRIAEVVATTPTP